MILLAIALMAAGQETPQRQLAQIDRDFVCPEDMGSVREIQAANEKFVLRLKQAIPNLTVTGLVDFRIAMLRKHQCNTTLRNMGVIK